MNSANFPESLKGHFLIAMPHMQGSGFAHTVTYMCEHDEQGAMGLVINRPTGIALGEILERLNIPVHSDSLKLAPIYAGGPVQPDHGFILHSGTRSWDSTLPLTDRISLTTSKDILAAIADDDGPEDCLVALGYAGWGAGQLEQELADNSWINAPADLDIIFNVPCEERLDAAAALLGVDLSRIGPDAGHA